VSLALILTYHGIEPGPPPLCVDPGLFARHLDCIVDSGASVLTVSEIAEALRQGRLSERAVAITFDDGLASAVHHGAPLLAERGFVATIFCVAGRLGLRSDWPSRAAWAPTFPLAAADELAGLAGAGWEIGSHGVHHDVLDGMSANSLRRELEDSRASIEEVVHHPVRAFAYPYGVVPDAAAAALEAAGYAAGCTLRVSAVRPGTDPFALPRVDAHYLRRPGLLRAALAGRGDLYLRARGLAARARRHVRKDYVSRAAR
jgi:peptidoglycan/xylan/chitin deacetylase (PgdA/CDA1 family)